MKKIKPLASLIIFAIGLAAAYPFAIRSMGESYGLWQPGESIEPPDLTLDAPDQTTDAAEPPVSSEAYNAVDGTTAVPKDTTAETTAEAPTDTSAPDTTPPDNTPPDTTPPDTTPPDTTPPDTTPPDTTPPDTTPPDTVPPDTTPPDPIFRGFTTVDRSYFDDALFIGDSRTVGLRDYSVGNLKNATFFCCSGMSARRAMRDAYEYTSGVDAAGSKIRYDKVTLTTLLSEKKYGKIYIMVGINEMGDYVKNIVGNIGCLKDMVGEYQPDALIFVCANLHVTKEYSDKKINKFITNERIDEVNAGISDMADNKRIFYINVNELFDDEDHALIGPYSGDGVHVYGKYYRQWSEWLCTKGILNRPGTATLKAPTLDKSAWECYNIPVTLPDGRAVSCRKVIP